MVMGKRLEVVCKEFIDRIERLSQNATMSKHALQQALFWRTQLNFKKSLVFKESSIGFQATNRTGRSRGQANDRGLPFYRASGLRQCRKSRTRTSSPGILI